MINIIENEKLIDNAIKLTEKSDSNTVFLHSLKILTIEKKNCIHKVVFGLIEIVLALLISKRIDTIEITENVFQVIISVMLALLAVVFTGYAFFQALINDKMLISLVVSGDKKNNKLYESNTYFVEVMSLQIGCILLDLLVIVFMMVLPENWVLFSDNVINEIIATIGICILLYCNVESIWEMKNFIFNVFQLFNLHAYSRIVKIVENHEDDKKD